MDRFVSVDHAAETPPSGFLRSTGKSALSRLALYLRSGSVGAVAQIQAPDTPDVKEKYYLATTALASLSVSTFISGLIHVLPEAASLAGSAGLLSSSVVIYLIGIRHH